MDEMDCLDRVDGVDRSLLLLRPPLARHKRFLIAYRQSVSIVVLDQINLLNPLISFNHYESRILRKHHRGTGQFFHPRSRSIDPGSNSCGSSSFRCERTSLVRFPRLAWTHCLLYRCGAVATLTRESMRQQPAPLHNCRRPPRESQVT